METFVKIRHKETGLYKVKRPGSGKPFTELGDIYTSGNASSAMKAAIRCCPWLKDKLELVTFAAFELKDQDWLHEKPTTVPQEPVTWDSIRGNIEQEMQLWALFQCMLWDICEADCDGDLPVSLRMDVRPNVTPNHYESLLHNHDDDPEIAIENVRSAQANLRMATEDMRMATMVITNRVFPLTITRK